MTWPREGSREIDEGIIVSVPCDWCKSPTAIIPYKIWARQVQASNLANSVRATDDRLHVKDSIITSCYGDDPGVGGGVKSGTHNAECTTKTWSESVFAEKRNVVRHDDEWWMNHKNTWGRLVYLKDESLYIQEKPPEITPLMNLYEAKYTGNQQAFEFPFEIPPLEDFPFEETVPRGPPVEEPVPSPTPDPVPGPEDAPPPAPGDTPSQDAPTGGGKPKAPSNNQPKDPNTDRDPKAEPDPKEKPKPDPPPPGARFSRCRKQVICFDTGGKDLEKYMEQLKTQQNAINRKSACKNAADIENFDQKSDQEKKDYRASGDEQKEEIQNLYEQTHPNFDRSQYNALHELDMVVGGDPKTFSGVGDAGINKSIGARWNQKNRKNDLWNYAKEMCAAKCKMAVVLAVCSYVKPPAGGLVA